MKTAVTRTSAQKYKRLGILLLADIIMLSVCVFASMLAKFAPNIRAEDIEITIRLYPFICLSYIGVFALFRMYHVLWRYADARQLILQALAVVVGCGVTLAWNELVGRKIPEYYMSRYYLLILCAFALVGTCSLRLAFRVVREYYGKLQTGDAAMGKRLLIAGAGNACGYVVSMCARHPDYLGKPVAIVDDDAEKQGLIIQGVHVVGRLDDIPEIAKSKNITDIIVAMPSLRGERLQQVITICKSTHCYVRTLSDPERVEHDFQNGKMIAREPDIADFLSRAEVRLDTDSVSEALTGKTVMVTGGGGSIGSEICRRVMQFNPKLLLVYDIYENCAYELQVELRQKYGADCPIRVLIGSIRDRDRLTEVMNTYRPDIVFNAAAHKHVPLMEDNPTEAVKNNIFGTLNVIETANEAGCRRFVQISTDKAVNPTNVMGATKRVTEMITQISASTMQMECMAVRFGNVLGSHGSVIPLFVSQIRAGGPITLTHPDIERYFMTIPEAAQLVLQAASLGGRGKVYVLDMGSPVKIKDLADKLIRFYGLEPDVDIATEITGLRPGEKMYEELLMADEASQMERTQHDRIMVAPFSAIDTEKFKENLEHLRKTVFDDEKHLTNDDVVELLTEIVPTFTHSENE